MRIRSLVVAATLAVALPASPTSAVETVPWNVPCRFTGVTNYLAVKGQVVEVDPFGNHLTFRDYRCKISGFRIEKSRANTKTERKVLRAFARENADEKYPTVFCRRKGEVAVMIDLQWFWNPKIKKMSDKEANDWPSYVRKKYGKSNPDCRLFRSK